MSSMNSPSQFLLDFESRINLGPVKAAAVLGIAYPTYAAYRSMSRKLPKYHANQIYLVGLLSRSTMNLYIEGRLNGNH